MFVFPTYAQLEDGGPIVNDPINLDHVVRFYLARSGGRDVLIVFHAHDTFLSWTFRTTEDRDYRYEALVNEIKNHQR